MRDNGDFPPELSDHEASAGFARSVHSLTQHSQVTVCRGGDGAALPALAAGASALGTGWFSKQKVCSPDLVGAPGTARNPLYSPHPGLLARFRRDIAEALADRDRDFARAMRRDQDIPVDHGEHRVQHLQALRVVIDEIAAAGPAPAARVPVVRARLDLAAACWEHAVALRVSDVGSRERTKWISNLKAGFERYAGQEQL